jgi:hypothetical protein
VGASLRRVVPVAQTRVHGGTALTLEAYDNSCLVHLRLVPAGARAVRSGSVLRPELSPEAADDRGRGYAARPHGMTGDAHGVARPARPRAGARPGRPRAAPDRPRAALAASRARRPGLGDQGDRARLLDLRRRAGRRPGLSTSGRRAAAGTPALYRGRSQPVNAAPWRVSRYRPQPWRGCGRASLRLPVDGGAGDAGQLRHLLPGVGPGTVAFEQAFAV